MMVNISYLKADRPLSTAMWLTGEPNFVNTDIEFNSLYNIVSNSCIQYSPYSFYAGMKLQVNWNNDKQNILVFDIDDGMTLTEASDIFNKYTNIITTTKSHRLEKKGKVCDRFRIILPATNIPKGELYFEMLDVMSKSIPMDTQVNTKTGAFLGFDNAIVTYNEGIVYDCKYAISYAELQLVNKLKRNALQAQKRGTGGETYRQDIKALKGVLNGFIVKDILDSLGYRIVGNKFKLREDERTESCKVFPSGYIIDYGGNQRGDIFELLFKYHGMNLHEAMEYVSRFIQEDWRGEQNGHR